MRVVGVLLDVVGQRHACAEARTWVRTSRASGTDGGAAVEAKKKTAPWMDASHNRCAHRPGEGNQGTAHSAESNHPGTHPSEGS